MGENFGLTKKNGRKALKTLKLVFFKSEYSNVVIFQFTVVFAVIFDNQILLCAVLQIILKTLSHIFFCFSLLGVKFITTRRGTKYLWYEGFTYSKQVKYEPGLTRMDYKCTMYNKLKCKGRAVIGNLTRGPPIVKIRGEHNHLPQIKQLPKATATVTRNSLLPELLPKRERKNTN